MNTPDIIVAIIPVVAAFEQLNIPYHIGGSVASSVFGLPRSTIDADLVADIHTGHVRSLVRQLEDTYYIDADMIRDAIVHRSSFNLIHLATMIKIDVFILKSRAFDQEEFKRVQLQTLPEDNRLLCFASPEDVVLNKLEWYKMGNEISDRQWNDVLGVLKVQGTNLDMAYMQHWAKMLNVAELLQRALADAGIP